MKKVFLMSLFIIIISCSKRENKVKFYEDFEKEIELKGCYIGPLEYFLKPIQIISWDTLLIIQDEGTEKFLHILDLRNNFNFISSIGIIGKGPDEFIYPEISRRIINNKILLTDKARFYSSFHLIDTLLLNNRLSQSKKYFYPTELIIPFNIQHLYDTLLIGSTSSGTCRLFKLSLASSTFNEIETALKFKGYNLMNRLDIGQVLYSINDYNVLNKKIVSAMRFFDRIDIFDMELNIILSIQNKSKLTMNYRYDKNINWIHDNTNFFYIDVVSTVNYIYGLYCGKNFNSAIPNVGNEIHVFNWNGDALLKIRFSNNLCKIFVPEGDTLIYGIDQYNEDQPIVRIKTFL